MINIRSAKQMYLARIETIYNHIHDEEVGIVPCVFNGIPDVQLVCLEKISANLKYDFRLAGIFLLILYILTTIIKSEFRLAGGLLCHIYKER